MSNLVQLPHRLATAAADRARMDLLTMLMYRRPHRSKTERKFNARYIAPLGAVADTHGNYWLEIGEGSQVLWSSHTDTVHYDGGIQKLTVAGNTVTQTGSNCLGADCTTGVWLMREMALARVPGVYVWHRGEEKGGIGSRAIAKEPPKRLDRIQYAIAFDRRATGSIITHQSGERTASAAFAASIAPMLPGRYSPDDGGSFTDTANYSELIAECTNISVGYDHEHGKTESQDIAHAMRLREAMLGFDESRLVAARDPSVHEYDYYSGSNWGMPGYDATGLDWRLGASAQPGSWRKADSRTYGRSMGARRSSGGAYERFDERFMQDDQPTDRRALTMYQLVTNYPDELADWLEAQGLNADDIAQELGTVWR